MDYDGKTIVNGKQLAAIIIDNSVAIRERISSSLINFSPKSNIISINLDEFNCGEIEIVQPPDILIICSDDATDNSIKYFKRLKLEYPDISGIALSNKPYPQNKVEWQNAGIKYFFDKSTEFEKIIDVCENLV